MAEGRQGDQWNHTAAVLALLANAHRDPKKSRPFKPQDFHPTAAAKRVEQRPIKGDIRMLKQVFVDRKV
jgi:hypothetical protein